MYAVKELILKANHNYAGAPLLAYMAVKELILKANHNTAGEREQSRKL